MTATRRTAAFREHRAIVAAHESAVKRRESGKDNDVRNKELQTACKGLVIAAFSGMKHRTSIKIGAAHCKILERYDLNDRY